MVSEKKMFTESVDDASTHSRSHGRTYGRMLTGDGQPGTTNARYLRTLHIVWSLVRRRVTRRLTRLQTMYNILKFSEK